LKRYCTGWFPRCRYVERHKKYGSETCDTF